MCGGVGGGVARRIGKIGKRLCFPSAPSSWVCRFVESMQVSQDGRPKSKVLFPYSRGEVTPPCTRACPWRRFWGPCDKGSFFWTGYDRISKFLKSQIPQDSDSDSAIDIEIGNQFDVISLLGEGELFRLNGDKVEVEHLIGKNVVVLCAYVPLYWSSQQAPYIRDLPVSCTLAFSNGNGNANNNNNNNNNYEVVVVPKMRNLWATDEDAFHHFLSDFPSSWLAIPFSHPLRRNSVCNSLALRLESSMCLFVDHTRKVLLHDTPYVCHRKLWSRERTTNTDWVPWWKHSWLDSILGCNPSDHVHHLIDPATSVSISELNNKLVGLYFCNSGSFIRTLDLVHQECKSKGLDFEIVLIYLPTFRDSVNPQLFQDAVNYVLHDLNIHNWWVLPHDDFRCRRFKDDPQSFCEDELIIVGPRNQFVDPYGKHVISCFGLDAYPFTVDHVVEKRYQQIRALTLESLLGDRPLFDDPNDYCPNHITAQGLRGKTVLLYLDLPCYLDHEIYFPLLEWYFANRRTRKSSDFEVVFVDLYEHGGAPVHMPWRFCYSDPQHFSAFLNIMVDKCLLAFGKDGHILSLNAQDLLHSSCDPDGIESYKGLRNDVFKSVQADFSINGFDFND